MVVPPSVKCYIFESGIYIIFFIIYQIVFALLFKVARKEVMIFTVAEEGQPARVVRINEAIAAYESGYINRVSQDTYEDMKYALTRIKARVAGE